MTVNTQLNRRFINTTVDPNDKAAWAKWCYDLALYLDDISRVQNDLAPASGTSQALTAYLTQLAAAATYETIANAVATYLTQLAAAATYETIANAVATYLTQANAAATYLPIAAITKGSALLSGGTFTVNTVKVTANSLIFLSVNGAGTLSNLGEIYEDQPSRVPGTSFTIKSTNALSNATVAWFIIEP